MLFAIPIYVKCFFTLLNSRLSRRQIVASLTGTDLRNEPTPSAVVSGHQILEKMATAVYLEHYLDGLESLPLELLRNFNLMRDLDTRSQDLLKNIDKMADEYTKDVYKLPREKRGEMVKKIEKLFEKSREYGDDKVQLAMQTYEMVDKQIRKLDADLARFEAELKEQVASGKAVDLRERSGSKKKRRDKDKDLDDEVPKKKKRKSQQLEPVVEPARIPTLPLSIAHASDVLDMPVDPNEPTYCICRQVSYGEMIGCDNPDCPIEWFHFACVTLPSKPKGKWFCPRCTAERKKKHI